MYRITALALLLTLLAGPLAASPELKGNPEELRGFLHPNSQTLVLRDSAEETAYSDQAIVNLVITTEDKTLSAALEKNTALRASIKQSLISQGLSTDKIKNSQFSSSPEFGWFGKEPSSYKVVNRMAIRIEQEKTLQDIASIADQSKDIVLSGTQFEHSKKDEFTLRVKEMALKKVMEKKAFYEKTLGLKLVPISFDESINNVLPTQGASDLEEVVVTGMRQSKSRSSSLSDDAWSSKPAENSFDEIKYSARISVEFKIN